jgi:hypothetical protein
MKPPVAPESPAPPGAAADPEGPGLPWFRTWRGVYLFVLGCFVTYVVLLTWFTRLFSR